MFQENLIAASRFDLVFFGSSLTKTYMTEISLALVMTALAIYGNDINGLIRRRTQNLHFLLRQCSL